MNFLFKSVPSFRPQALDERRLRLLVDSSGVVTHAGDSPASLFGFDPATLKACKVTTFIDVLQLAGGEGGDGRQPV